MEYTHNIDFGENTHHKNFRIKKLFPNSTEKMLIETLELLLKNKIIKKKEYEVYPKHTEYKLTSYGVVISEILKEIQNKYNEYKDII